jgi:D-alanine--poly(phosphoribitol) ligase subunit 2
MISKSKIIEVVFRGVDELNSQLEEDRKLEKSTDSTIFGRQAKIDSLALVNLIVAVEAEIADEFDVSLTLADERAMSQKTSPFLTIGTLVDYIFLLLKEQIRE